MHTVCRHAPSGVQLERMTWLLSPRIEASCSTATWLHFVRRTWRECWRNWRSQRDLEKRAVKIKQEASAHPKPAACKPL